MTNKNMNIVEAVDYYKRLGYVTIDGCIEKTIVLLSKDKLNVVRIGCDPGYDTFASSIMNGELHLTHVVKIISHKKISSCEGDFLYTITEMEHLQKLTDNESQLYEKWIKSFDVHSNKNDDPFGLLHDIIELYNFIIFLLCP